MTQETCKQGLQVRRLDYSKPPPGYEVQRFEDGDRHPHAPPLVGFNVWGPEGVAVADFQLAQEAAVAAAWAHYKAQNDPPGMRVYLVAGGFLVQVLDHPVGEHPRNHTGPTFEPLPHRAEARAAAWAWHDRRHALMRMFEKFLEGRRAVEDREADQRDTERARILVRLDHARSTCVAAGDLRGAAEVDGFNQAAAAVLSQPALLMTTIDALDGAARRLFRALGVDHG